MTTLRWPTTTLRSPTTILLTAYAPSSALALLLTLCFSVLFASSLAQASTLVSESEALWQRAISNDNIESIKELLTHADNPQEQIKLRAATGKDALMIACKMGDIELVHKLIGLGADPESTSTTGGRPVMFAVLGNHPPIVDLLLKMGIDINVQGSNGWSALTIAAAKGYRDMLEKLAVAGADMNALDVYRWTPLMRAVDNGHLASATFISGQPGVDLDNQDEAGNTALHHAVANERIEMIKLLIARGAKPDVENFSQQTVRQLALTRPNASLLLLLFPSD